MNKLPFLNSDPTNSNPQYLEDLATAYWFSEVLFASIELKLFDIIETKHPKTDELASLILVKEDGLLRLLNVLERMELVKNIENRWINSQTARIYLVSDNPSYMGNFFLYRKYMQTNWKRIIQKISFEKDRPKTFSNEDDYSTRTFNYVRAMDELARQKGKEIPEFLSPDSWNPPVLDVGGGAGALAREIMKQKLNSGNSSQDSQIHVDLIDLSEVLDASEQIYKDETDWKDVNKIIGDFRNYRFNPLKKYGLVIFSNFLHVYDTNEAERLFLKGCSLLKPDGMVIVHDYFPDRKGSSPSKGPIYDLNMMINTFNGRCHHSADVRSWFSKVGMRNAQIQDLCTDSSIIIGSKTPVKQLINLKTE